MPYYGPTCEELRHVIERERSFNIHQLELFHISWNQSFDYNNKGLKLDNDAGGKQVADRMKATAEALPSNQFGKSIMDDMFHRFSIKITECLEKQLGAYVSVLLPRSRNEHSI